MSKKVKLKTDDSSLFSRKLNIPIDGEVQISKKGVVLVSDDAADLLLARHNSFYSTDSKEKEKEDEDNDENDGDDEDQNDSEGDSETDEEKEKAIAEKAKDLEKFTLKQLIELAKNSQIPEEQYKSAKNSKKEMIKFLSNEME